MKRFLNDENDLVREAIDGLVASSGGHLARLDGFPSVKVVLRTDHEPTKVAVISGGGAGHEPAHAGFVGQGMLTAAVSGEIFASPSVTAVLAAILAVTGEGGCLLVVKNYTGDRLNFGLAAERAKALGRRVEVVIVGDDVAIENAPQPRGVAGTLFVHKIAGHLAEAGASLETVANAARSVAADVRTLGLALETCTLPGQARADRIAAGEVELGLGIHGEPGFEKIPMAERDVLVQRVANRLEEVAGDGTFVALVNNLGTVPPIEMFAIARALVDTSLGARIAMMIGPAPLMTSLDMNGFSISLLPLDDDRSEALSSPVAPSAWPGIHSVGSVVGRAMPEALAAPPPQPSSNDAVRATVEAICAALVEAESDLDALDAKVGDGDAGATLAGAARILEAHLDELPFADGRALLTSISALLGEHAGGSSGVLLAITTASAAEAFDEDWPAALLAGVAAMKTYGGAARGDRTMIDALEPALEAAADGSKAAAAAARAGADETAGMTKARAGRSSYLNEDALSGNVDPGAEAVARVFERLARG